MRAKHLGIAASMAVVVFVLAPVQAHGQGMNARVQTLEAQVAALQTAVAALTAKLASVTAESGAIEGVAGPHFIITGVNVHIRSGSGRTDDLPQLTGLGNLIIGYNEERAVPQPGDRGGAHNLVIGPGHRFLGIGGFVAGLINTVSGDYASVLGGHDNTASGRDSSVSGGFQNTASGQRASVGGGGLRSATGLVDWVAGSLFQDF